MKQNYPYYEVYAQVWYPPNEKFHEGEYFSRLILQTEDKEEAEKVWKSTEMTPDFLHIELYEVWEDEDVRLAYKDLIDDGTVDEVYGE